MRPHVEMRHKLVLAHVGLADKTVPPTPCPDPWHGKRDGGKA